jgi:hypothetical protein
VSNQPTFFFDATSKLLLSIDMFDKFREDFLKRTKMHVDDFNDLVAQVKRSDEYKKGRKELKANGLNTPDNLHVLLAKLVESEYKRIIHKNDCCKIC